MKEALARFAAKYRLKPYHLAFCVLFVGWAPSLLLAYYSYSVLSRTLEAKIMTDARSLVRSLSQHVKNEVDRAGDTLDYYCTLPATVNALQPPPPPAAVAASTNLNLANTAPLATAAAAVSAGHRAPPRALPLSPATVLPAQPITPPSAEGPSPQEWLASIFFPQKRDGMFLTNAAGHVVALMPELAISEGARDFSKASWWKDAINYQGPRHYFSPVYHRPTDGRFVTSVIAPVRDKTGKVIGYLGADILIEFIGNRLQLIESASGVDSTLRIVDQNNFSLFNPEFKPNALGQSNLDPTLIATFRQHRNGVVEVGDKLYIYSALGNTGWIAVLEKSSQVVHQPVQDLLRQILLLASWLLVGTACTAYVLSGFYRRQLQSSLRIEREQIFNEKILANMPVGIALIDPSDESFLQANGAFVEIARSLGSLPRHADLSHITFSKLPIASHEALARVLHFGVPYQAIEQRTPTASGQIRYLTTNLLRLQDSFQRTLGALCLVEDSTAAVALRQELINANTSKDQFLAQLSHELRNPLSPVITMVAELEAVAGALPGARQPLEIIRRNVQLEARLIDDLLDVTRISSGKLQLNREVVDVHRIIRLALEICQGEIDEKGLNIRLELQAQEHWVKADPARLQQVFWNLIKNGVKFTEKGRRIIIRSANPAQGAANAAASKTHINFVGKTTDSEWATNFRSNNGATTNGTAAIGKSNGNGDNEASGGGSTSAFNNGQSDPAGHYLRVEIIDEGIGIEPQNLARIFTAFDQGQSSITRRFGGLGLGLAISKAMVEAHGGALTASSEGTGRGATFAVELETCPAPPAETPSRAEPTALSVASQSTVADGCRVLLVDDHEDTCLGMKRLLNRRGYQVTTAHSVTEGLECAGREKFDLLISDIGLPDGTGFDLMNMLRQRNGPPGIALSGYGMENDIGKSREAGFSEHLIKPVDIERLDAAVRKLLKQQKAEG